jgi:hypothetical protein
MLGHLVARDLASSKDTSERRVGDDHVAIARILETTAGIASVASNRFNRGYSPSVFDVQPDVLGDLRTTQDGDSADGRQLLGQPVRLVESSRTLGLYDLVPFRVVGLLRGSLAPRRLEYDVLSSPRLTLCDLLVDAADELVVRLVSRGRRGVDLGLLGRGEGGLLDSRVSRRRRVRVRPLDAGIGAGQHGFDV